MVVLNGINIYPGVAWCTVLVSQLVQSNIARNYVVDRIKGNNNVEDLSTVTTKFSMNNDVMT